MRQQQQQQQQENPTSRRMTLDDLWKHLETNVSYKKFYYEAFLTMMETSDAELDHVADPFFNLCADQMQPRDMEQLLCDIVMYRCDTTSIIMPPSSVLRKIGKIGGSTSDPADDGEETSDDDSSADDQVRFNRHRPWYQGYSQGFVDGCGQLLQMMMNVNNDETIIKTQRSTILAFHEHFQQLQQSLRAVLKHTANTTTDNSTNNEDPLSVLDTLLDRPIHEVDSRNGAMIALLLQPLEPFLTPQAYQEIHSTLVGYDATKHKDVVLLGYCRGAIDVCSYILKWTQLVVVQEKATKQRKKKINKFTSEALKMTHDHSRAGSKTLVHLNILASKMGDIRNEDAKTTPDATPLRHPAVEFLGTPRTPCNTPRRVSCGGKGEQETNESVSSDTSTLPLLQFITRPIKEILPREQAKERKATQDTTTVSTHARNHQMALRPKKNKPSSPARSRMALPIHKPSLPRTNTTTSHSTRRRRKIALK